MEYERNFVNAADYLRDLKYGGEVEFIYNGVHYSVTNPHEKLNVMIAHDYDSLIEYDTHIESLNYPVGNNKTLGDIFAEMKVTFRSL